jgi:hypothetical protein
MKQSIIKFIIKTFKKLLPEFYGSQVHNSKPPEPVLSQINTYNPHSHSVPLKICFNIILPSRLQILASSIQVSQLKLYMHFCFHSCYVRAKIPSFHPVTLRVYGKAYKL